MQISRAKRVSAVALAVGMLLVASPPSLAAVAGGPRGGHDGGAVAHHGFEGHHFEGHHFEGHDFDRHDFENHRPFGFRPVVPYSIPYDPPYSYVPPDYWYYCPNYGQYYPYVTSCPEAWVPVAPQ